MNFKEFIRKEVLISYFVTTTCIAAAMAVVGLLLAPEERFGYGILFSPLIYGTLVIPVSLVGYSKRELSIKETLVRNIIQLLLIEFIVLLINYVNGVLTSISVTLSIALSILAIYIAVCFILWINDKNTAKEINKALLEIQKKHKEV